MKRAFVLLICASLITACAPAAGASGGAVSFAVASDVHYEEPRESIAVEDGDGLYFHANRSCNMPDECPYIIEEFLRQCADDENCRFVLLTGDNCSDGRGKRQDHIAFAKFLSDFEESSGKPVYVIPGNHDIGGGTRPEDTGPAEFKEIYDEFGYEEALTDTDYDASYTADLPGNYRLIALDSVSLTESTEDGMTLRKVMWVCDQARQAKKDGREPILIMHHALLGHMPLHRLISRNFIVRFHNTTANLFASAGIKLVFTGHEHGADAAVHTTPGGKRVYDLATGSLSMYPLTYRYVTLTDGEISYETRSVDKIDAGRLTSEIGGYTGEQKEQIENDLEAYAKGMFAAGFKKRIGRSLSVEDTGLKPGGALYALADAALSGISGILDMPLYGKNSASELAAGYGIILPESGYATGWDLLCDLMSMHYAGGEDLELDGPEVTLFLRLVSLVLKTDLSAVTDAAFELAFSGLSDNTGALPASDLIKLGAKIFGPVSPGEKFLLALVSPVIYGFISDGGIPDNCGTLPGYGADDAGIGAFADAVSEFVNRFAIVFAFILHALTL